MCDFGGKGDRYLEMELSGQRVRRLKLRPEKLDAKLRIDLGRLEEKALKDEYNCGKWRREEGKGSPRKGSAGRGRGRILDRGEI